MFKVGSLREHVDFWSDSIRASDFIINTIVEGYRIPFFDLPENFNIPNRSSAFKFKDFVNEAISELMERGCVQEVLNPPKFINPLHGTWLGSHLDFCLNFITVPLPKITKLQESISRILALRFVNAKDLASVAGQLNSMFLAIGNIVHLMSRAMYAQISARNSWFSNFRLEDSVVEELVFWQSNLDHLNGRRIWFKSSAVRVAYSDASDTGYGGYIVELGPQVAAQGVWSADLAQESSTMREILAVRKVLQSFAPKLAGLCVKWHTDNQNVARIIGVGSRKAGLQSEAKRIFEVCVHHGISIEPEWVPRFSNEQADYLSRIVDFDDWSVSPHIFRFLDLKWGPHSIDRFADEHNHLLPRFDSRFWNPYCEAMDRYLYKVVGLRQ